MRERIRTVSQADREAYALKFSGRAPYKEVVNCISGSEARRFAALHLNAAERLIRRFYLALSYAVARLLRRVMELRATLLLLAFKWHSRSMEFT